MMIQVAAYIPTMYNTGGNPMVLRGRAECKRAERHSAESHGANNQTTHIRSVASSRK
jgi:hypothetical protein